MPDFHPLQIPPAADSPQLRELLSGVEALSPLQQFWLSGYLAGKAGIAEGASAGVSQQRVVVLYASQTGNGVGIANRLQQQLAQAGVGCELFDALDYRRAQLKTAEVLLLIASTHGEGDVPDTAVEFAEYLNSDKAAVLESVKYSVLALGDRSYVHFCKVGREFHQRLSDLGAEEGVELQECDSDFSAAAQQWTDRVCDWLRAE
ncbi:MAG TPA: sulfite reductase [NADPH] flavoprotein alpha-component, partial [Gammaproteobacteria bacterium]|nr:sulfite reductase [NADPH] flavoprotein alpha-component [Gammaproteobacteria bacterium]